MAAEQSVRAARWLRWPRLIVLAPVLAGIACADGAGPAGLDPPLDFSCEEVGPSFVDCEWQNSDPTASTEIWALDGVGDRWYFYEVLEPGMARRRLRRENCPTRYRARHVIDEQLGDWSRPSRLFEC